MESNRKEIKERQFGYMWKWKVTGKRSRKVNNMKLYIKMIRFPVQFSDCVELVAYIFVHSIVLSSKNCLMIWIIETSKTNISYGR
jgi:hypothetical protein